MNRVIGISILAIIIIAPLLVYIFLKNFGRNHYTLKTYFPIDTLHTPPTYHQIPDFNFVSQTEDTITQHTFDKKIYVADFFFTRCGNICPKMTSQLARVQQAFKNEPMVKIISYSVDPEYDRVEVLKAYANRYHADSNTWYFLTGKKNDIDQLAQKGYLISSTVDSAGNMDHSQRLVLIDTARHIRGYYNGTDPEDVDRLILEIKILLYEYKKD